MPYHGHDGQGYFRGGGGDGKCLGGGGGVQIICEMGTHNFLMQIQMYANIHIYIYIYIYIYNILYYNLYWLCMMATIPLATGNKFNCFISARGMLAIVWHAVLLFYCCSFFVCFLLIFTC